MKRLLICFIGVVMLICSPVFAMGQDQNGWTDAKWGMTGPELEKAFAGKITKADAGKAQRGTQYVIELYH